MDAPMAVLIDGKPGRSRFRHWPDEVTARIVGESGLFSLVMCSSDWAGRFCLAYGKLQKRSSGEALPLVTCDHLIYPRHSPALSPSTNLLISHLLPTTMLISHSLHSS